MNKKKKSSGDKKPVLVAKPPPQLQSTPREERKATLEMESESMVVLDRAM
jgi:hypothetical protein